MRPPLDWPALLDAMAPGPPPASLDGLPPAHFLAKGADAVLWRAIAVAEDSPADARSSAEALHGSDVPQRVDALREAEALLRGAATGPLLPPDGFDSLEVWTECELSALHALWRLARISPHPARAARLQALIAWHLEYTQPDNATNRPWALHAFVRQGSPEAHLYAETLLHNVSASEARHEPLTRWILRDSARELRLNIP